MNQNPPDNKQRLRLQRVIYGYTGLKCFINDCVYQIFEINKYMQVNERVHNYYEINTEKSKRQICKVPTMIVYSLKVK